MLSGTARGKRLGLARRTTHCRSCGLGRVIPCSDPAKQRHKIIRNRLALVGEESVSGVTAEPPPGQSGAPTHACRSPGSGRITAPGSSGPQALRIVQRKRRPTSNVDSMIVLRARRAGTGSKYVTFRGGLRRAIPFLLVRSGWVRKVLYSMRTNGPAY